MGPMDTEHAKQFDASLERWDDNRFITREQIRTLAMFNLYLVNLAEHDGWVLYGWSWKESSYLGCLVVKADVNGVPSVVFTSGKTPVSCMGIFLRKMEHEMLEWVQDKYRS